MDSVYHVKLGDSRRLALPADLCRRLDLKPGEELLVTQSTDGLSITSLRIQAERMREELRQMLGEDQPPLTRDLKKLRQTEAAREADLADASAILAYLQFEPGGELVEQHLPDLRLTAVNLAEIVTVLTLRGIQKDWIESRVLRVFSNIIALDREQAALTGYLVPLTQELGLSLGDRACLAAGVILNAQVLTADAAWRKLKLGIEIILIR